MKILVIGIRGIPDIPGGVETHCQELYSRISEYITEIIIIRRKPLSAHYWISGLPFGLLIILHQKIISMPLFMPCLT